MTPPSMELVVYRLDELKRGMDAQDKKLEELAREMQQLREEVAGLKVKSGVWGAVAGAIPAAVVALWYAVKGH